MPIFRRCTSCHELYTGRYCPACKKEQDRRYRKRKLERQPGVSLYHSRLWQKCRKNIREKYRGYDIWLLGVGIVRTCEPGKTIIHHIKELEEAPDLIYDIDNLIICSIESHNDIHAMYKTDKAAALERINAGIRQFYELFGDQKPL